MRKFIYLFLLMLGSASLMLAQTPQQTNPFKQLYQELPTPNEYHAASGAPGHAYWQQQVDYDMKIRLDDENQRIYGEELITYHNNSPDELTYLWLQLDQNMRAEDSDTKLIATGQIDKGMSPNEMKRMHGSFDGGFKLDYVKDKYNKDLRYVVNKTMMRVDPEVAIAPGASYQFKIKWWYNINDRKKIGGRSGYEYFPEEDNYLYTIAQFFPRLCVYNEVDGWQNKQFLGRGEFTLSFGNYRVEITAPADHVVASTGLWQNVKEVLNPAQRKRLDQAYKATEKPVFIVNAEEALENEKSRTESTKTWIYEAENVRDFAFASSRKFIWDAMVVKFGERDVLCMSYYPKEGNPLWERYSTMVVAHTVRTYSKYTVDYPYPVAISVHTDRIGMEYPMICFNGGRPEPDGTYSKRTKYGMIGVIIHEVGHNFFPMIINSDERQWTWMDEGLNTFVQYLTEVEWERDYPSRRGPAANITDYMGGDKSRISPIMTNSESIWQFGNNAYAKPATALNILRETIMGRELFDYAFKEYATRWAFKHPTPADFFRTMEDASGVDLDWFWRGWFYTTDHVDISLDAVSWYQLDTQNPEVEKGFAKQQDEEAPEYIGVTRNREQVKETVMEKYPELRDFYNKEDEYAVDAIDERRYKRRMDSLDQASRDILGSNKHYYEMCFSNRGGLVMPVILEFTYEDGSKEEIRIPAEIWRKGEDSLCKIFMVDQPIVNIVLDPHVETADVDVSNNYWPPRPIPSRFQLFKERQQRENPMQRAKRAEELKKQGPR
jgi:hypothetical protein